MIEKEDDGEPIAPAIGTSKAPDAPTVKDISGLVKKRKVVEQPSAVEESSADKKAKLD